MTRRLRGVIPGIKTLNDLPHNPPEHCNVAVVGGGPAGLAAATELKRLGVAAVVVLEREPQAGGIPRHCGHPPFGMREFKRCYTGPQYAGHLVKRAQNAAVGVYVNTTVVSAESGGNLTLSTPDGIRRLQAERVILSTGARETPRAPRLVSGQRPLGIMTSGTLQSMVYLKKKMPLERPVIIGTELVSLSVLLTCRHIGIKPVAMLEQNGWPTARPSVWRLSRVFGVPVYLETRIDEIIGARRVTEVRMINVAGETAALKCDGVVFTGRFTPESALLRMGHLEVDAHSGGPVVDQFGRCSDPAYFAAGNLLRPVETAGWCWREGVHIARCVRLSLSGRLRDAEQRIPVRFAGRILKYVMPQVLSAPFRDAGSGGMKHLQLRFLQPAGGRLSLRSETREICSKSVHIMPERRVLLPLAGLSDASPPATLKVEFACARSARRRRPGVNDSAWSRRD